MKFTLLIGLIFLLAFVGTIVGVLSATGQLNKETFQKLLPGQKPETVAAEEPKEDDLSVYSREMKEQKRVLEEKQKQVQEREQRLVTVQTDIERLLGKFEAANAASQPPPVDQKTKENEIAGLKRMADTLVAMDDSKAAAILQTYLPDRAREAAKLLNSLPDEKKRARILSKIDEPKLQATLLEELKNLEQ